MRFTYNGTIYMITDDANAGYRISERGIFVEDTFAAFRAWRKFKDAVNADYQDWLDQLETQDDFLSGTGRV